jgi:hypothetical protein
MSDGEERGSVPLVVIALRFLIVIGGGGAGFALASRFGGDIVDWSTVGVTVGVLLGLIVRDLTMRR